MQKGAYTRQVGAVDGCYREGRSVSNSINMGTSGLIRYFYVRFCNRNCYRFYRGKGNREMRPESLFCDGLYLRESACLIVTRVRAI